MCGLIVVVDTLYPHDKQSPTVKVVTTLLLRDGDMNPALIADVIGHVADDDVEEVCARRNQPRKQQERQPDNVQPAQHQGRGSEIRSIFERGALASDG